MKVVFMYKDECGDSHRAYQSDFIAAEHEFPAFDEQDEAMFAAYCSWQDALLSKANEEMEELYPEGWECSLFIEEEYSSKFGRMSLSQLEAYADYMGW